MNQLEPKRFWPSQWRALSWLIVLLVLNSLAFLLYQQFRPGFLNDLLNYPRLAIEIIAATGLIFLIFYFSLSDLIPGKKITLSTKLFFSLFSAVLILSLYFSFSLPSPESSTLGARAFCVEEVLLYGLIGLFSCFYFIKRNDFPLSRKSYLLIGAGTMLVPGFLMQLACMYSPTHGLLLHYGPILFGLFFGFLFSLFNKVR